MTKWGVAMKKWIFRGMMIVIVMIAAACVGELTGGDYMPGTNDVLYEEWARLTPIEVNGLWGLMNMITGERIVEPQFAWVSSPSEGLAFVRGEDGREYQTGYIDFAGNLVIPLPEISEGRGFSEGLAFVRGVEGREDITGYIDMVGNLIIPIPSTIMFGDSFSEGLAFVRGVEGREDLTGFIDLAGDLVIPLPTAIVAHTFSDGFAVVIEREWNYDNEAAFAIGVPGPFIFIDRTGQNAFGREFGSASDFRNGLTIVSLDNGNMIFMNTTGRNAFRREFLFASEFVGNYAEVTLLNGTHARINRHGRTVRRSG